jgi:hypothetical protein
MYTYFGPLCIIIIKNVKKGKVIPVQDMENLRAVRG